MERSGLAVVGEGGGLRVFGRGEESVSGGQGCVEGVRVLR